ncbi:hypothetical protein LCI18_011035 [Fusarium solani-melongenae]|uniref:Uncharacterized protein n=2 Tax=Fusarium solani subsp. cucurbitae TaxID=2747967 RepID=A0ACD3ZFT7_FUSSC|nr:hypothetical protein LCI18_010674 [Fusarium solani-melongenae]UPL00101.1 hypothetical protein LCI18_011035 [Fusarium solani-melongenae]
MGFHHVLSIVAAGACAHYKSLAVSVASILIVYCLGTFLFSLFLHPLAKFPGPKLAAWSQWWLSYQEAVKGESLTDILRRLHATYAHCDIYNQNSRWDKDKTVYAAVMEENSSFGMTSHRAAKQRREIVQPFYSRRNILKMQDAIDRQMQVLVARLTEDGEEDRLSDLSLAFRCLAQDVMTEICLGISSKTLDAPGYKSPLILAMDENLRFFVPMKAFPAFRRFMYSLPPSLTPGEEVLTEYETMVEKNVNTAIEDPCSFNDISPVTMLPYLVSRSDKNKLDTESLIGELQAFIVGGGETVASAMVLGIHGILRHPDLYPRLQAELTQAWPNVSDSVPGLEALEKLPLLTATIKESLRLTHGVVSPLPRIVPEEGAEVDGHFVPGGTSVGVSHTFVHLSSSLFQDPHDFEPQRWLDTLSEKGSSSLDKYLGAKELHWGQLGLV